MIRTAPWALVSSLIATGCGGAIQMDGRFIAVHNAMAATGLVQSGEISQGSLAEGGEAVLPLSVAPGDCYTIVGLGSGGVQNLDVIVRDQAGNEISRDRTEDAQAATQVCPRGRGELSLVIRMGRGSGGWIASVWSGGRSMGDYPVDAQPDGVAARTARGGPGSCEDPLTIEPDEPVRGNTADGDSTIAGSCIEGSTAPERVYSFMLDQRARVTAVMNSSFDGSLYLLGACGVPRSELACNDDAPSTSRSEISATLEPGTYYLVVDGFGNASGDYEVTMISVPMREVAEVCAAATVLQPGQQVAGVTRGEPDYFHATCAGEARSPDRVYAIDVPAPSRMRVRMSSTYDGAIYVRSDCGDQHSEIACNDDHRDTRHSLLVADVEPGRYYVVADGFSSDNAGEYSLLAELTPRSGGALASGDACTTPAPLTAGTDLEVDTFAAADDLAGTCGGQGAPDLVYRVDLASRSRLRTSFGDREFAPVVYLQSACGAQTGEIECVDPSGGGALDRVLAPGTYFLVVDGAGAGEAGAARMSVRIDDLGALEQSCRAAPLIRPGTQIVGNTTGSTDRFEASCAGGARSPDLVYRLQLRRRQRVRIASEQQDFDGAIYIRRDCTDATTEVACNDDAGDNRHTLVEVTLEPGTYFIFMDGYSTGQQGQFTLDVDLLNP